MLRRGRCEFGEVAVIAVKAQKQGTEGSVSDLSKAMFRKKERSRRSICIEDACRSNGRSRFRSPAFAVVSKQKKRTVPGLKISSATKHVSSAC